MTQRVIADPNLVEPGFLGGPGKPLNLVERPEYVENNAKFHLQACAMATIASSSWM